jgi:hypothetical protein
MNNTKTPINNTVLQGVIGFGSLEGWTRHQCYEEFSKIKEAAKAGGLRLKEWDKMDATLSLLMEATTCDQFSTLVRMYMTGPTYQDQKFDDAENWFLS